jgi:hypothetical protein
VIPPRLCRLAGFEGPPRHSNLRELFDCGCFDESLGPLKQVAELSGSARKALTEERVDRDAEESDHVRSGTDRPAVRDQRARRSVWSIAVSVRFMIIRIQPLRRRRVNARCTAPRRR